jgi:hypothetical protein
MRLDLICCYVLLAFPSVSRAQTPEGIPVVKIVHDESSIKFGVKASVAIEGVFDKWDATLTYTSRKWSLEFWR